MDTVNKTFGVETFNAGEIIFRQGDAPDKFYIIMHGRVNIIRRVTGGHEELINTLSTGDYFGEIGMARGTFRIATVQAATDVTVMGMGHDVFTGWLNRSNLNRDEIDALISERTTDVDDLTYLPSAKETAEAAPQMDTGELRRSLVRSQDKKQVKTYATGDIITKYGTKADYFYVLIEGKVEILAKDGSLINTLNPGSYFGEMAILENRVRSATIRALTPVQVMTFDKETFTNWMKNSPFSQNSIMDTVEERKRR